MKTSKKSPRANSANTNPAILPIEAAAKTYADARCVLAGSISRYEAALRKLQAAYLPAVKVQAAQAATTRATLEGLIDANRALFDDPRTITLHGIKLGLQKGKGKVEFTDPDKVVERIRAQFGKAEAELLLDVKTTPRKDALLTLDAAALKKLGVTITGTGDSVVIKAANGDVEKLVERILAEGTKPAPGEKEAA